jgi:hypothetical protein
VFGNDDEEAGEEEDENEYSKDMGRGTWAEERMIRLKGLVDRVRKRWKGISLDSTMAKLRSVVPGISNKSIAEAVRRATANTVLGFAYNRRGSPNRISSLYAMRPNEYSAIDGCYIKLEEATVAVLIYVDIFSRITSAYVCFDIGDRNEFASEFNEEHVIEFLRELSARGALAKRVISDNAKAFRGNLLHDYIKSSGRTQYFVKTLSPASNGVAERRVGLWKHLFQKLKSLVLKKFREEEAIKKKSGKGKKDVGGKGSGILGSSGSNSSSSSGGRDRGFGGEAVGISVKVQGHKDLVRRVVVAAAGETTSAINNLPSDILLGLTPCQLDRGEIITPGTDLAEPGPDNPHDLQRSVLNRGQIRLVLAELLQDKVFNRDQERITNAVKANADAGTIGRGNQIEYWDKKSKTWVQGVVSGVDFTPAGLERALIVRTGVGLLTVARRECRLVFDGYLFGLPEEIYVFRGDESRRSELLSENQFWLTRHFRSIRMFCGPGEENLYGSNATADVQVSKEGEKSVVRVECGECGCWRRVSGEVGREKISGKLQAVTICCRDLQDTEGTSPKCGVHDQESEFTSTRAASAEFSRIATGIATSANMILPIDERRIPVTKAAASAVNGEITQYLAITVGQLESGANGEGVSTREAIVQSALGAQSVAVVHGDLQKGTLKVRSADHYLGSESEDFNSFEIFTKRRGCTKFVRSEIQEAETGEMSRGPYFLPEKGKSYSIEFGKRGRIESAAIVMMHDTIWLDEDEYPDEGEPVGTTKVDVADDEGACGPSIDANSSAGLPGQHHVYWTGVPKPNRPRRTKEIICDVCLDGGMTNASSGGSDRSNKVVLNGSLSKLAGHYELLRKQVREKGARQFGPSTSAFRSIIGTIRPGRRVGQITIGSEAELEEKWNAVQTGEDSGREHICLAVESDNASVVYSGDSLRRGAVVVALRFDDAGVADAEDVHAATVDTESDYPTITDTSKHPLPGHLRRTLLRNGKVTALSSKEIVELGLGTLAHNAVVKELQSVLEDGSPAVADLVDKGEALREMEACGGNTQICTSQILFDLKIKTKDSERERSPGGQQYNTTATVIGFQSKARLVPIGHQQKREVESTGVCTRNEDTSPTTPAYAHRIVLSAFAQMPRSKKLSTLDVKRAFLQSTAFDRGGLLVAPPFTLSAPFLSDVRRVFTGKVLRLNRPLYGLVSAARDWHMTLKDYLLVKGFTPLGMNPSIFILRQSGIGAFLTSCRKQGNNNSVNGGDNGDNNNNNDAVWHPSEEAVRQFAEKVVREDEQVRREKEVRNVVMEVGDLEKAIRELRRRNAETEDGRVRIPGYKGAQSKESGIVCIISTHVDDLIIATVNERFHGEILREIKGRFEVGDLQHLEVGTSVTFTGLQINRRAHGVLLNASEKCQQLPDTSWSTGELDDAKKKVLPNGKAVRMVTPLGATRIRRLRGVLRYITNVRPDMMLDISAVCRGNEQEADETVMGRFSRIMKLLRETADDGVYYPDKSDVPDYADSVTLSFGLLTFVDASPTTPILSTCHERQDAPQDYLPTSGSITYLLQDGSETLFKTAAADIDVTGAPVDWSCGHGDEHARCSYAPEINAFDSGLNRIDVLREMLIQMGAEVKCSVIMTDSESLISKLSSGLTSTTIRTPQGLRSLLRIKSAFDGRQFALAFVSDRFNVADILTKHLPGKAAEIRKALQRGFVRIPAEARAGRFTKIY